MSVYVFGFWEIFKEEQWQFAGNLIQDEAYGDTLVPQNAVPFSWGSYNFTQYYEVSGERGLPDDLSLMVAAFQQTFCPSPNRPSWISAAEIIAFFQSDQDGRFAHLSVDDLLAVHQLPPEAIRLVFWAE